MAQPATNPKIEELRFRLKTDPKSRLFYQLAEELRKGGQVVESEQVLRSGLEVYPTYLAAWVSLGRALRELKNETGAIEALSKAMQLDPGNVVAARLMADAYRALGDNVEAIKKYKLVHALMPGDEDLKATIEQLDRQLQPAPAPAPAPPIEEVPEPPPGSEGFAGAAPQDFAASVPDAQPFDEPREAPVAFQEAEAVSGDADVAAWQSAAPPMQAAEAELAATAEDEPSQLPLEESPFDRTIPPFDEEEPGQPATGDAEPMLFAHDESPFEEPLGSGTAAAFELEQPAGMHVEEAPLAAEVPAVVVSEEPAAVVFAEAAEPQELPGQDEPTSTSTMADLYARQGLLNEARHIYEDILARDPGNAEVRAKLEELSPRVNPRIERLERWLSKVGRKEVGRV
jgi:tetratricopeptide (TPR) repeat protein